MSAPPDLSALLQLYRGANLAAFPIAAEGAEALGRRMAGVWQLGEQVAAAAGDEAGQAQLDAARARARAGTDSRTGARRLRPNALLGQRLAGHLSAASSAVRRRRGMESSITIGDFERIDVRAGVVVAVRPFPEARKPAYKLDIDFGPELGVRASSAQITDLYAPEDLVGRLVAAVVNLPPRKVGSFVSEVLVLGFPDRDGRVVLATPERDVPPGARLY